MITFIHCFSMLIVDLQTCGNLKFVIYVEKGLRNRNFIFHERVIRDDVFMLSSICKETDLYKISVFPNPCRILQIVLY
jgi:hypothetical protein